MDKYIVEIDGKNICSDSDGKSKLALSVKSDNGYAVFCTEIPLTPYTDPDLEQIRMEAYDKGYDDATAEIGSDEQAIADKAYQKGLSDAWKAARTLWNTSNRKEIFGNTTFNTVLTTLTAQKTIEKIRQYEQRQEEQIRVGDEVFYGNTKGIVIRPEDDDRYASVFTAIGEHISAENKDLTKTGRHFPEIAEVFAKMKEIDNG